MLHELQNSYETHYYWCRSTLEAVSGKISGQALQEMREELARAEKWVEEEQHSHKKGTEDNVETFQLKMKEIKGLREALQKLK